jgi:hypothetical protein
MVWKLESLFINPNILCIYEEAGGGFGRATASSLCEVAGANRSAVRTRASHLGKQVLNYSSGLFCYRVNNPMMQAISVERTDEAIVIKLPLDKSAEEIQAMLHYFRYVELGMRSQITQEQVDELAKEAKVGWWARNKHRFIGQPGFEDFE